MKIMVLGSGNIGSVVARDIAENLPSAEVVIADFDRNRARDAASRIGLENIIWTQVNATNSSELSSRLKNFDVAVGALPGELGYQACKASVAAKVDMVDVSYMPEDVMTLNNAALKAGVSVVPDCGMSPGLCSMIVGRGASKLDEVDKAHMLNGGLPEKPVPPLDYVVTWSAKDLIDMYSRKVSIVKNGKVVKVEAMSGLEEIDFPGVGKLEAFYTDGLRTLLYTVKAKEMWEKTLRYPGHTEKIKLLKALGFFDSEPVEISGTKVEPREVSAKLFEKKMKRPDIPDIAAILIKVNGTKDGKRIEHVYRVLDHYDKERQVTSMARTTAYTASVVTQLLVQEAIEEKGVIPPEKLGMNDKLFGRLTGEMRKKKVFIKEEMKTLE
jgi:saccharopine dehydrogenase-like NADP-dependent oxidoreductase